MKKKNKVMKFLKQHWDEIMLVSALIISTLLIFKGLGIW